MLNRSSARAQTGGAPVFIGMVAAIVVVAGLQFVTSGELRVWLQVVLLGIVEGVTEFLPISSTAHLLIVGRLIGFEQSAGGTFEVFIQLGAVLAVVVFYAADLLAQARALTTSAATRRFWLSIVLAFLPAAVVGLLLRKWIKAVLFQSPALIAGSLIVGGMVLIIVETQLRRMPTTDDATAITPQQALAAGGAQVLALVPGVSRSASSIVGGMLAGLSRSAATVFSFYLVIPTLGAATLVDLVSSRDLLQGGDMARLLVGAAVAFVTAWLSIGWLLRYVASSSFVSFGVYRIIAGTLILLLLAAGRL